jgi:DNA polymerase-4
MSEPGGGEGREGAARGARHPEPILHLDMDAFYASVEQRDDADLRGRPVAVGSPTGRGVVAAASYEARAFGVRSAMPMVRARRLCPDLVVVRPDFDRYHEASRALMGLLRSVTPLIEPLSLDEAFLDVSGSVRLFGDPSTIAALLRSRVRAELSLPCSVGVASTKSVAKLLSGLAKPDGVLHWPAGEVASRLRPLSVDVLWGAGPRTTERLVANGITTVGQVADVDVRLLRRLVGDALGSQLHELARGVDPRPVVPASEARSVSAETTFTQDVDDPVVLERRLLRLATDVTRRLRGQGLAARTVTVKVRFSDHTDISRSQSLPLPTDRTHELIEVARTLLHAMRLERVRVRLVGFRLSGLGRPEQVAQLSLLDDGGDPVDGAGRVPGERWEALDRASDAIIARFGSPAMSFAALLDDPEDDVEVAPERDERSAEAPSPMAGSPFGLDDRRGSSGQTIGRNAMRVAAATRSSR